MDSFAEVVGLSFVEEALRAAEPLRRDLRHAQQSAWTADKVGICAFARKNLVSGAKVTA